MLEDCSPPLVLTRTKFLDRLPGPTQRLIYLEDLCIRHTAELTNLHCALPEARFPATASLMWFIPPVRRANPRE